MSPQLDTETDPLQLITDSLNRVHSTQIADLIKTCIEVLNLPILEATSEALSKYQIFDPSLLVRGVELNKGDIAVVVCYPASIDPAYMSASDITNALSSIKILLKVPGNFVDRSPEPHTIMLGQNILTAKYESSLHEREKNPFDMAQEFLSKILSLPEIQSRKEITIFSGTKNVKAFCAKTHSGTLFFRLNDEDRTELTPVRLIMSKRWEKGLQGILSLLQKSKVSEHTFKLSKDDKGGFFMVTEDLKSQLTTS